MKFPISGLNIHLFLNGEQTSLQKSDQITVNLSDQRMSIQRSGERILFIDQETSHSDDKFFLGDDEEILLALQEVSIISGLTLKEIRNDDKIVVYELI